MDQLSDQKKDQTSYEEQFSSSSENEGAVTLHTSINDNEFQLVYQAREESVDGGKLRKAKNMVDFAKTYHCGYILLIDGSCWVSPDKGISLLAQIEGNEKLEKYEYVVFPLDYVIYIAKINEGIVVEERVRPLEQAVKYLQKNKNKEIAVLAGGHTYEKLANYEFIVNCDLTLFTIEPEVATYRFKAINLVLISNLLIHPRLLVPVLAIATSLLAAAFLFSPLYSVKLDKAQLETGSSFLDLEINANPAPNTNEVKQEPKVPKATLNNSATQFLTAITPWVTGKTINFLRTCRLKTVELSHNRLIFTGERMSNIKKNQIGCGNARLDKIIQVNGLKINRDKDSWTFNLPIETKSAQTKERRDYSKTLERLELIGQHIGWRLNILSNANNGNNQRLKVLFQGKNLNNEILNTVSQGLSQYATNFIKGSLQYNPNNFDLLDAQFEIDIHTQSSGTL